MGQHLILNIKDTIEMVSAALGFHRSESLQKTCSVRAHLQLGLHLRFMRQRFHRHHRPLCRSPRAQGMQRIIQGVLTAMMEVLLMMKTCSTAMVGTSAMRILRRALAMAALLPISSNSMSMPRTQLMTTLKFFLNCLKDQLLSMPSAANSWALSAVETCQQGTRHSNTHSQSASQLCSCKHSDWCRD